MRCDLCLFALEEWLSRFPGFVDDLGLRLRAYASSYCQSFENVSTDSDGPPENTTSCAICSCSSSSCTITMWSSWRIMSGSTNAHDLPCPRLRQPIVGHLPHPLRTLLLLRMVWTLLTRLFMLLLPRCLLSLQLLGLRPVPYLGRKYRPLRLPSSTWETVPCISLVPT